MCALLKTCNQLTVKNSSGGNAIVLSGQGSAIELKTGDQNRIHLDGANGNVWLGGNGTNGDVVLFNTAGDNKTTTKAMVVLNGSTGNIRAGGPGVHGNLALFRTDVTEAGSVPITGTSRF